MNKSGPIAIKPVLAREGYRAANAPEGLAASGKALGEVACLSPDAALQRLSSIAGGLTPDQVEDRLRTAGPNQVAHQARHTIFGELVGRSINPLNLLLLSLATTSYFLGDQRAAIVIAVMVLLSISLSFIQEHRSNNAADKLQRMVSITATVRRQGGADAHDHIDVPIEQLVPGDIVLLSAGDMIPADLRLISAKDLFVNQSTLTGEAMPIEKVAAAHPGTAETPFDLPNICFMGSAVVSGFGSGVVVLTGPRTAFGLVASAIAKQRVLTSFDKGITRFTWLMLGFIVVMAPLVFVINGLTKGNWLEALLFAVAVAVGLTPEMLPMIVTVNLAKGALAMSRRKVIVKRLNSIQNFGAMDVLCTDKTGTLTQDRIILKRHLDIRGNDSDRVLEYAYLNSFHQSGLKNLLDVAVLKHVELEGGLKVQERFQKIDEMPFDFERRRMSVVLGRDDGVHILVCKGAVEEVFAACKHYAIDGETGPLDDSHYASAMETTAKLNADGFRVVAVAFKEMPATQTAYSVADEADLTLLGYIAFLDPPKETCAAALATLKAAGVQVKILTGDNDIVTRKICHEVGLAVDRIVLGSEIATLSPDELAELGRVGRRVCQGLAVAEGCDHRRPAPEGARRRIPWRWYQRRTGAEGRGRRRIRGQRRRHRQGLRGHHLARKELGGARRRRDRGPQSVRQHHQIYQDGRQLEFRQHVQRARRQRLPAVSADDGDSGAHQQPAVRLLADHDPDRQRRRRILGRAAAVGHQQHREIRSVHRPNQLDLRLCHVFPDALRLQRLEQSRFVPKRLVRRIPAHTDAHHPHHPHREDSVS